MKRPEETDTEAKDKGPGYLETLSANRLVWLERERAAVKGLTEEQLAGTPEPAPCARGGMCSEVRLGSGVCAEMCRLCYDEHMTFKAKPGRFGIHKLAKHHQAKVSQTQNEKREILEALRWEKQRAEKAG